MRFTDARAAAGRTAMNVGDLRCGSNVVQLDGVYTIDFDELPISVFVGAYPDSSGFCVWACSHDGRPVPKRRQFRPDEFGIERATDFATDMVADARRPAAV